jgi:hypothetical protein
MTILRIPAYFFQAIALPGNCDRKLRLDAFREIGDKYEIDNDRMVGSVVKRMKKQLAADRNLARNIEKLQDLYFQRA